MRVGWGSGFWGFGVEGLGFYVWVARDLWGVLYSKSSIMNILCRDYERTQL